METLRRWHRILLRLEDGVLMLLLLSMILLATTQILLRDLLETGLSWADPVLRLLVLWLALLGAMAATRDHNHIRIDLLSRFLPPHIKQVAQRVTDGFAAGICGLLAWHAGRFVLLERADGTLLFSLLPAWMGELILPFGFGVIALRFLLAAVTGATEKMEAK